MFLKEKVSIQDLDGIFSAYCRAMVGREIYGDDFKEIYDILAGLLSSAASAERIGIKEDVPFWGFPLTGKKNLEYFKGELRRLEEKISLDVAENYIRTRLKGIRIQSEVSERLEYLLEKIGEEKNE